MKKIKICLRQGHHSVYKELIKYPPEGVKYTVPPVVTQSENKIIDVTKKLLWRTFIDLLGYPHIVYVNPGDAELIHGCSGILIKNKKPWVIDVEHVTSFVGFRAGKLSSRKKIIEDLLSSPYCRKILPWSKGCEKSIKSGLNTSKFSDKIEVVYPAMHVDEIKKQKHDTVNFLFIGRIFYEKGGREVLKAFDILNKRYDVRLDMISNVPREFIDKYRSIVNFAEPNIQREMLLRKYFAKADVYIMPTYFDTFGMVYLEALSHGLAVIGSKVYAVPEIVENGKTGLLIDPPINYYKKDNLFGWPTWEDFGKAIVKGNYPKTVKEIVKKASILIEDTNLRKQMSKRGKKEVENGKFSIKRRNRQLKRIYEEAINK